MNKNVIGILLVIFASIVGCNQNKENAQLSDDENNPEVSDATDLSENEILYNEVQKIHDEVMPKMYNIYQKKQELQKKLEDPKLTELQKQDLQSRIAKLDSADAGMRDWMHNFKPISDSEGEEKAREYLEGEMEKVKKVRDDILTALREADQ